MDPSPQVLGIEVLLRFKVRLKAQLKVIPVYVPSRAPMLWLSALVATKVIIKTAILITSYWKAYGKFIQEFMLESRRSRRSLTALRTRT